MQKLVKWLHGVIFINSFHLVNRVFGSNLHLIYFMEIYLKSIIFVIFRTKSDPPPRAKKGGGELQSFRLIN